MGEACIIQLTNTIYIYKQQKSRTRPEGESCST